LIAFIPLQLPDGVWVSRERGRRERKGCGRRESVALEWSKKEEIGSINTRAG